MCVIQRYFVIYPDGHREPRQRLCWCPRGTPNCPCNQTEIVDLFEDEIALPPEAPPAPQPRYQVIEPRAVRGQPQPETLRYRKKTSDGLKAVWDIHIPFTSWNKKSKPQERKIVVRERERNRRPDSLPPVIHPSPPMAALPPPPPLPPIRGPPMMAGPLPRPAVEQNELALEREGRRRAERIAREEHDARIRAQKDADKVRRQRDREKKRNDNLERNKKRLEQERRDCAASAERQRRRNAEERARAESRERARRVVEAVRRQEEEQIARAEIREQGRRRAEEALRRQEEDRIARADLRERARLWAVEAVRRREEERVLQERAWRLEEEGAARVEEERERIARRVQQMIPREPRHPLIIYQFRRGSFEARGDRVIDTAIINAEERRQAEEHAGWFRRRSVGGGRQRRDQVAVGERRIFEDDLRRVGRRFF